ncbi:transmembrane protein, putative [Bodo saltans]|uniref:Transmembrane protein, putative n=1 Tax=Bodo saltans TaxID=75058 RepID=A0A0S4ISL6_BODSA|nr:transmembrane protein, putative [Bodo saltans]|eukprot:CUF61604.1 transmembrane protein, putative [Bodo saltans]
MSKMRADPEGEIGITREELLRRQKEAQQSLKVNLGEGKTLDIKSSARAQQIVQRGTAKLQQEKRRKDLADKMELFKKGRWVFSAFAFLFVGYLATEYLLPQYARIQQRGQIMEMRRVRAEAALEKVMADREAAARQQASSK